MNNFFSATAADLNTLFNQAPAAIAFLKGPEQIVAAANTSILKLWGKEAEVIGNPLLKALPELAGQPFPTLLKEVYDSGQEHHGSETLAFLVRDGVLEPCFFNFVFSPVRDPRGKIIGVSVVATEVTEQVKAKKRLEESENRFRSLVFDSEVSTAIYLGKEMVIDLANEKMLQTWGKDESVIGKTLQEALPELENQPFHSLLAEVYRTGITYKATEDRVDLVVNDRLQTFYYNFTYKALRNDQEEIYGILNMAVNVTEQVLARQRTEESEKRFQNMILQAPVAICVFKGESMVFEVANDRFFEIIDRGREVLGKPLLTALPELSGRSADLLYEVYRTGKPYYGFELPATFNRNGKLTTGYYNFTYTPLYEDGKITGVLDVASEVTELVLAKRKAQESEAKFRNLIQDAPVPTALLRGENMVLELANDAMLTVWGRDRSILGRELLDFMPELQGQPYPQLLSEVYHSGNEYSNTESRVEIIVNGLLQTFYLNFTYKLLQDNEEDKGILVMCIDVTEQVLSKMKLEQSEVALKASEDKLKELADSMPQIVWTAGSDGKFDYFNKQWYDYNGLEEKKNYSRIWARILNPAHKNRVLSTWKESVQTGKPFETEFQLEDRRNGSRYRWFLGRAVPVRNEEGKIIRWIGTNTDIDEFKILQQQKDVFLSIASHELKTPVTSLKAYTQVLEAILRKEGDNKKANLVRKLDLQINRLISLIEDLLDVTKIQTGRMEFNQDNFDFNELVEEIVEELQFSSSMHTIATNTSEIGLVIADRHRLGQVITNLITNATKYSPKADKVVVHTKLENQHVVLCVQDFGIGIPPEKKDKVFEQFYRVLGDKQQTFSGLGLGLYISSEIIKKEGGRIWVDSIEGKGSTFCFSIPVKRTPLT